MSKLQKKLSLAEQQKIWYAKLKKQGFDDIEYADGSLRKGAPKSMVKKTGTSRESIEEYYYMANHFLNNYKFANNREQIIWEYHTNGLSVRNISAALKKVRIRVAKTQVNEIINRLSDIMRRDVSWRSDYQPPEDLQ